MSSKSTYLIIAAVLAAAIAGMMMISVDSEAAIPDDTASFSDAALPEEDQDRERIQHDEFPSNPVEPEFMMTGPGMAGGEPPRPVSGQCPMDSADKGPRGMGPAPDNKPRDHVIVIPEHKDATSSEQSSTKQIVEEYEQAYYESVDLKDKSETVVIVDNNTYTDEQAEIVSVMRGLIDGTIQVQEEIPDFLMQVVEVLESVDSSAAQSVKDILDERFFGREVIAEFQQPTPRSKEDLEDDMGSDPVYIYEESDEEDDVPDFFGTVDEIDWASPVETMDTTLCVQYYDRGNSVAI